MATTTQLRLKFGTLNGEKTWTYRNMIAEPTLQQVNNLMDTMIANGTIYDSPPLSKVSARLVVTDEREYQLT